MQEVQRLKLTRVSMRYRCFLSAYRQVKSHCQRWYFTCIWNHCMSFWHNISRFFQERSYRVLTISAFIIILIGTIFYRLVEGLNWLDAVYFSIITLTSVGYGDISPQTDIGKVFTSVYILVGIGIIFGFINAVYKHQLSNIRDEPTRRKRRMKDHHN